MRISGEMIEDLVAHAREDAPNECCGMIGGADGRATTVYRATNAEASPLRYRVDPQQQLRIMSEIDEREEELVAIYHSHTASPAYPSQTDINLAELWPDPVYVIVSLEDPDEPSIRAFWIREGQVDEAELVVE
jgi:[CysO sulfur-carrier protein]-S-L-cysteine hydrolase